MEYLQHLAMMLRQQALWEDESLFDRPAQKDSGVRKKGALSKSEAARRFGVNRSTVQRYLKRLDEEGSLVPRKAPGKASKLDEGACDCSRKTQRTVLGLPTLRGANFSM